MELILTVVCFTVFGAVCVLASARAMTVANRRAESAERVIEQTQQDRRDILDRLLECLDIAIESKRLEAQRDKKPEKAPTKPRPKHRATGNATDGMHDNGTAQYDLVGNFPNRGNDPIG